jgi:hypothetical protein
VISFSYPDQIIGSSGSNNDYDCEAMVVNNGKIFLFTKQWISQGTALYELPALPGTYSATLLGTQNVGGLITGADIDPVKNVIVLVGYNTPLLNRFIYLLYDYNGNALLGGNKRKITVSGNRQTESIAFRNPEYVYIANENSLFGSQRLESINLTSVLSPYLALLPISQIDLTARAINGYVRLDWNIQPRQEFWKGEIQRRSKNNGEYETLTMISKASGVYYDHKDLNRDNVYRVKAVDKNLIESYGQEQTVNRTYGTIPKIYYSSQEIRISLPASSDIFQIKIMDMMGRTLNKISTVQRNLSISTSLLPQGIYQVSVERNGHPENQYRFFKN